MSVNWTKLVASGRAKDIGVSWNQEELESLVHIAQTKNMSFNQVAPVIRKLGPLSVEDFEKKSTEVATREELETRAAQLGVAISNEIPDTVLESEVARAVKAQDEKKKADAKERVAIAKREKAIVETQTKPAKAAKKTTKKGAKNSK